ncbi:MAG: response regulator [Roseibium sp.]
MLHKMIRVLLVGGDATTRDVLKAGVAVHRENRYIELDAVDNKIDALEALSNKAFDIVFVDLDSSGQNGEELFAAVKDTRSSSCLFIAISKIFDEKHASALKQSGAYDFLQKPFRQDEVSGIVATFMTMTVACPILIVDDSATMRKMTRKILDESHFSFEISEADCARSALRLLSGGKIKIVLTDYHMPGGDGLELAGAIRDMSSKIGIYMMSTNDTTFLERSAAFVGISGFLKKPFTSEDINALMRNYYRMDAPVFGKTLDMFSFAANEKKAS